MATFIRVYAIKGEATVGQSINVELVERVQPGSTAILEEMGPVGTINLWFQSGAMVRVLGTEKAFLEAAGQQNASSVEVTS